MGRLYTISEIEYLKNNYHNLSNTELGLKLNRSRKVIGAKLHKLGLKRPKKHKKIQIGAKKGHLTVLAFRLKPVFVKRDERWTKRLYLLIKCDCGTYLESAPGDWRRDSVQGCGCVQKAMMRNKIKHGHTRRTKHTKTYNAWASMKSRCNNPNEVAYKYYGARGITYDKRWESFEFFLKDMGSCPPNRSIERVDNNSGYFPWNCKWATAKEQALNRRVSLKNRLSTTVIGISYKIIITALQNPNKKMFIKHSIIKNVELHNILKCLKQLKKEYKLLNMNCKFTLKNPYVIYKL